MKKLVYKKGNNKDNWKKAVVVGAMALTASGAFWWIGGSKIKDKLMVPSYRALRVVDGDTFETTERQLIRLTGIDAPELENCGGKEASEALEKLIMGKNLYIKVIFKDRTDRLYSHVYNEKGLVGLQMVTAGMAYYTGDGLKDEELKKRSQQVKEKKIGIFSEKCFQETNKEQPNCVIKANVSVNRDGAKWYRFPGCGQYNNTLVQLYLGDRWFCSEKEAIKAGFTKGGDCFEKKWNGL